MSSSFDPLSNYSTQSSARMQGTGAASAGTQSMNGGAAPVGTRGMNGGAVPAGTQGMNGGAVPVGTQGVSSTEAPAGTQGLADAAQIGQSAPGRKVPGQPDTDTYECQTCKNRKYKDGSNDLGVSFKTPTHLDPERAAYAIRSHEMEHVAHAKADAAQDEDTEILSQSVTYQTAICPECGRVYMSGGTTRTTFRTSREVAPEPVETGKFLDQVA